MAELTNQGRPRLSTPTGFWEQKGANRWLQVNPWWGACSRSHENWLCREQGRHGMLCAHAAPTSVLPPITQRQRLINSANGVSSTKPLQNGRHENIENGSVPTDNPNPEEPQQDQEQPQPPPPPPEPEPAEAVFLSPFSVPGEFCGGWALQQGCRGLHQDLAWGFGAQAWAQAWVRSWPEVGTSQPPNPL